jgi:hypothetical protein
VLLRVYSPNKKRMLKSSLVENEDQKNKKTMKNYKMFRLIRLPDIVSMDVKVGKPH